MTINSVCGMATVFFAQGPVTNMAEAGSSDGEAFAEFFHKMIEQGIYPPPSPFEAWFVGLAPHPGGHRSNSQGSFQGLSQLAGLRQNAAEACALTSRRGRFETGPGVRREATLIAHRAKPAGTPTPNSHPAPHAPSTPRSGPQRYRRAGTPTPPRRVTCPRIATCYPTLRRKHRIRGPGLSGTGQ